MSSKYLVNVRNIKQMELIILLIINKIKSTITQLFKIYIP
jgi:hypothetical protein